MVDKLKLKGKIVEKGFTIGTLADKIGINRASLYRKMDNSNGTMLIKDADAIASALNLTRDEVNDIFFSQYVAQNAN